MEREEREENQRNLSCNGKVGRASADRISWKHKIFLFDFQIIFNTLNRVLAVCNENWNQQAVAQSVKCKDFSIFHVKVKNSIEDSDY